MKVNFLRLLLAEGMRCCLKEFIASEGIKKNQNYLCIKIQKKTRKENTCATKANPDTRNNPALWIKLLMIPIC